MRERKWIALGTLAASICVGSASSAPIDGANAVLHDALLDHMAGHWLLEGTLLGKPAVHSLDAEWILNHQFLRLHEVGEKDAKTGAAGYEAFPTIGYDNMSERYVAHWLDIFGGRLSETLGYGRRDGSTIHFVFEYPDGPFHTDFVFDPAHRRWHWHMTQKNENGKWTEFADMTMRRK